MFEVGFSGSYRASTVARLDSGRSLWQRVTSTWNIRTALTPRGTIIESKQQKHQKKKKKQGKETSTWRVWTAVV